jgi:hypothetical protein
MNERIQKLIEEAYIQPPEQVAEHIRYTPPKEFSLEKFAELIIKDMANELFVVYPGGKSGSDVAFQNISMRQWLKEVYGVDI